MTSSSEMEITDIHNVKARGHWVFLELEQRPDRVGSIHLPKQKTLAENVMERAGRVISMGPGELTSTGERVRPTGLEVGSRVMIRGFIAEVNHSRLFPLLVGDRECCFVHMKDLMCILPYDLPIGQYDAIDAGA